MKLRLLSLVFISQVLLAKNSQINLLLGHKDRVKLDDLPSTLYIEDPEVADFEFHSPGWLILTTKNVGSTNLYALDKSGGVQKSFLIKVDYPVNKLKALINNLYSGVKIHFKQIPRNLIIEGYAPSKKIHDNIMYQIKSHVPEPQLIDKIKYPEIAANTPSRQINLRVRIVEVRRSVSKALGIHWDVVGKRSTGANRFSINGPKVMTYSNLFTSTYNNNLNNTTNNVAHTLTSNVVTNLFSISNMIDLLEDDNFATTVQEPNLTVKAGEEASFNVGGSVPINRAANNVFTAGTVAYQNYGISLKYKAEFDKEDPKLIKLSVSPSVSDVLPTTNGGNPTLLKKDAKTVVELRSGQSIAIAGLVSSTTNSNKSSIPGISGLPIIGSAFRSEDFSRLETEIVFVITPYIVHATKNGMIEDSMDNTGMPKYTKKRAGFLVGEENDF